MSRFRIKKQALIAVAGIVWLIAGLNVAVLGVRAAIDMRGVTTIIVLALVGGAVAIFCAFHSMFSKLVKKNVQRIADLEGERHLVFRFFDRKSYVMMALMMSFGIGMRAADIFPDWFIAFFYTGLGLALSLAGASYIARGVRGISLSDGDEVVAMDILKNGSEVLTVTEGGYGKRTTASEYRTQTRGGKGLINMKVTDKTGSVVGIRVVRENQELMLITTDGIVIRTTVDEISLISRNTQGVKVVRLGEGDKAASFAAMEQKNN